MFLALFFPQLELKCIKYRHFTWTSLGSGPSCLTGREREGPTDPLQHHDLRLDQWRINKSGWGRGWRSMIILQIFFYLLRVKKWQSQRGPKFKKISVNLRRLNVITGMLFVLSPAIIVGIPLDGRRFLREDPRPPPLLISACSSALKYYMITLCRYPITRCGF